MFSDKSIIFSKIHNVLKTTLSQLKFPTLIKFWEALKGKGTSKCRKMINRNPYLYLTVSY